MCEKFKKGGVKGRSFFLVGLSIKYHKMDLTDKIYYNFKQFILIALAVFLILNIPFLLPVALIDAKGQYLNFINSFKI